MELHGYTQDGGEGHQSDIQKLSFRIWIHFFPLVIGLLCSPHSEWQPNAYEMINRIRSF